MAKAREDKNFTESYLKECPTLPTSHSPHPPAPLSATRVEQLPPGALLPFVWKGFMTVGNEYLPLKRVYKLWAGNHQHPRVLVIGCHW